MKKISLDLGPTGNNLPMKKVRVVVITTVMLSFISYWRASAIGSFGPRFERLLCSRHRSEGGGALRPLVHSLVMVFAYGIRAVYIESSSMFVREGVYRVVHEALGENGGKVSQFQRCFLITSSPLRSAP